MLVCLLVWMKESAHNRKRWKLASKNRQRGKELAFRGPRKVLCIVELTEVGDEVGVEVGVPVGVDEGVCNARER